MPPRPKLATAAAASTKFVQWDEFLEDANRGVDPFVLQIGADELLEVPCPTGDQMAAFGAAQRSMDDNAAAVALFGDAAPRIIQLTADQPFFIRAKLFGKMMEHYGMAAGQLPE